MNADILLKHFDRISEAPDAIPRLRRFILDLAVRGKLVEQDPNDEPASELLARIALTREKLLNEKLIKAVKGEYGPIQVGEDFEIPSNWVRSKIGEVCDLQTGATPSRDKPDYFGGETPWLVSGDVNREEIFDCDGRITELGLKNSNCKILSVPCVLMALNGQGKTRASVAILRIPAACNQSLVAIIPIMPECLLPEYLFWNLRSRYLAIRHLTGHEDRRGLNMKLISCFEISIPPLAEQHRIVAKVDELMALCDQLQAAQTERERNRDRLVAASLHRLNPFADDADANVLETQREHARFLFNYLPRLTLHSEHIKQLRQTILSLAVAGKLVPQDPNDESAGDLLKRIRVRRTNEKVKLKVINEANSCIRFLKPLSWEYCQIADLAKLVTDGEHATPTRIQEQEIPLVTAKNVRDGEMDYSNTDWVSRDTAEKAWNRCKPEVGDILLVCVGATTGRLTILREPKDMVLVRSVALIRPESEIDVDYLAIVIKSPFGQSQIWKGVKATAQPCLYINKINALTIPIPPLAEQHRIVAKVDELMALCDQLEVQLVSTAADSRRLLEAVLHEALLPAGQAA